MSIVAKRSPISAIAVCWVLVEICEQSQQTYIQTHSSLYILRTTTTGEVNIAHGTETDRDGDFDHRYQMQPHLVRIYPICKIVACQRQMTLNLQLRLNLGASIFLAAIDGVRSIVDKQQRIYKALVHARDVCDTNHWLMYVLLRPRNRASLQCCLRAQRSLLPLIGGSVNRLTGTKV